MQNLATLINNTQNTASIDDFLSTGQNYDSKDLAQKGKDFFDILNKKDNNLSNRTVQNDKEYSKAQNKRADYSAKKADLSTDNKDINSTQVKDNCSKTENAQANNADDNSIKEATNDSKPNKTNDEHKTDNKKTQDKTLDEVKSEPVIKEATQTAQEQNMQVLSADEVIQETVNKINNLIETSLDGQLNLEDVKALKGALEEIQAKINSNELVVSEDTKQMISDVLNRLLTQNPEDLEVAELQKDLKQLAQDIKANAFKLNSQVKMEEENSNPVKALEINISDNDTKTTKETAKKDTSEEKITQKTKDSQTTVAASKDTKEIQDTKNQEVDIEQDMLDEMDVKIEEVSDASTDTNSQNKSYTTAQDEVIKLQIQNSDADNTTPVTFAFDKSVKNINAINKPIQVQSTTRELNVNDILNQIGSKFEQLKDGSSTKITMTLRPNDLGRVTIELLSSANGISTNIIAQNSQVKELLDKNIDILKQQLAQQGINVQNVQVKTVEQNSQTGLNNGYNERQNQGQNGEQNPQKQDSNSQNNKQQRQENFKFNKSNVIENIDFESNTQGATASINTLRGKISYNL